MSKQLKFSDDARASLLKGIETVAKAVVTTLGPKGRNVALDKKWGAPQIIHDGVSVAKDIELPDPFENMGAQLVKEASSKTNDIAGDGTTTSTLLAYQMTLQGFRNITAGANPMIIKKGIERAINGAIISLTTIAKPVSTPEEVEQVATISAGDSVIGKKIAEALAKVGKNGIVTVEEGRGFEIEINYKEGMEFDKGYVSPYFSTNTETMEAEVENPYIFITDKKIASIDEIMPFLENFVKESKNLVIIADDFDQQVTSTFIVNKLKHTLNVILVKAPGYGDRRKDLLQDIAILTNGTVINDELGRKLDSVTLADLGQADKVWAGKDSTKIIGGKGIEEEIKARVENIKSLIASTTSEFERENYEERLAKLDGGVAVINVGAATETELNDKRERVKDAVGATKAAIDEGLVPGGGTALLTVQQMIKGMKSKDKDEQIGIDIVLSVLEEPLRWLIKNAGQDDGYIVNKIKEENTANFGYDVTTSTFGDMYEMGIIDPVKVTKSALTNAASVAQMVLTTECLVTDIPEKEEHVDH